MPEVKTQQLMVNPLPEHLDREATQTLEQSLLINGYLLGRYKGTGTMTVANLADQQRNSVENASPIQCFTTSFPHVITIHQDEVLQVFNLVTKQCDQFRQEKGMTEDIRRVLANSSVIVGVAPKRIVVWARDTITTQQPRIIDTTAAPMQIMSTSEMSVLVSDTRLVLMNTNPSGHLFQVWDLAAGALVAYAENPSKVETFFSFGANAEGMVVGTCRDTLYIWATAGAPGLVEPYQTVKFDGCLLSAVAVDSHLILVGDNFGGVTVHTKTGRYLYHLNRVRNDADPLDLQSTQFTQLTNVFRAKINKLVRVGRWVFAACENSRIKVFDIFTAGVDAPCDAFTHPTAGTSVRDICVAARRVYGLATYPVDTKTKTRPRLDLVMWAPKLDNDGLALVANSPALWEAAPVVLVREACVATAASLRRLDGVLRAEEFRVHTESVASCCNYLETVAGLEEAQGIELPFLLCQNIQVALDKYDACLAKIAKGSKGSKSREALEEERKGLMHALDLALSCADFLGEVKSRTNITMPYSEKQPHVLRADDASSGGRSDDRSTRSSSRFHSKGKSSSRGRTPTATSSNPGSKGGSESIGAAASSDDVIEDMLSDVIDSLTFMHEQAKESIGNYDAACNAGIHDSDKVAPLLSVYTKLRQLDEDLKETAKEIGDLRGDNPEGEWWEGGGDYDDAGSSSAN